MPCDYSKYPANWKSVIRPAILERDNHCCKNCGAPNKTIIRRLEGTSWVLWPEGMESEAWSLDGYKSTMIVLTVAHLDHDVTNNNYSNLAALCQKCHINHDIEQHKANARKTIEAKQKLQSLF